MIVPDLLPDVGALKHRAERFRRLIIARGLLERGAAPYVGWEAS